uniref:MFS general substrate transporter n=1 Tax=Psilocybe cubensis TaxID=181762 RepID=A0A8H8CK91_PSICU
MLDEDIVLIKRESDTIQPLGTQTEGTDELESVQDGGTKAWISMVGVWIVLFVTFGQLKSTFSYTYSFGVYQDFYTRIFLSHHSTSKIAWIGSFQLMMPFVFGVVSGKLFDAGYFHVLEITGSALFTFSLFMLSLVKPQTYAHVFLCQGLGVGLGLGLTFVPAVSLTVHHFRRRMVLVTGIVMSGSSIGAVMFPIMLNLQIKSVGFPKAVRNSAYIVCGLLVLGNCLMRTAYKKSADKVPQLNILGFFKDLPYILASIGAMGTMFGFYFPLIYLQLYAVTHGINLTLSFYSLAILNGASTLGRLVGNYLAHVHGPFNVIIPCTLLIGASIFSIFGM